jgi:hypothetical protein
MNCLFLVTKIIRWFALNFYVTHKSVEAGEARGELRAFFFTFINGEIPVLRMCGRFFTDLVCNKTVILRASQIPIHQKI